MARDYRTLKLEILAETKQFVDDMKKGEKQVETFGDKAKNMGKMAAAAFAAAAAAAAAYAGKLAIDGVKAAIEDAAAQERLKTALQNVIGASDQAVASTEEYISNMSLAYGVADDQLRPAYQRLATATGSLQQANTGLALAMDIAAGTGKSVEAVANALGKAYEGNLSSLGRLGVGMSAAEMKTLGLEGTLTKLSETFRDQASIQADTFQGQMARLQVRMDEAKETIGFALLPILEKLLNFFNQNIGPATEALQKRFEPLVKAIKDNKDELESLWNFAKTYLIPLMTGALKLGLSGVIESFKAVINIISGAVNVIQKLYNGWKDFIDLLKKNPITRFFEGINPFGQAGFAQAGFAQTSAGGRPDMYNGTIVAPMLGDVIGDAVAEALSPIYGEGFRANLVGGLSLSEKRLVDQFVKSGAAAAGGARLDNPFRSDVDLNEVVQNILTREAVYQQSRLNAEQARQFVINVNAPSVIDEEGFSRALVDALNQSQARTGVLTGLNI